MTVIIDYTEEMVGANHPTKSDTLNRALLVGHDANGGHKLRGHLAGLQMSNDLDAEHDIRLGPGECTDADQTTGLVLRENLVKRIDAAWQPGSDAGGLFAGNVAADACYHVFLIKKDADGSMDGGFDASSAAANRPSGYSAWRRLGSILTDGGANILGFIQDGDYFFLKDPPMDVNVSNLGTTSTAYALTVPSGLCVRVIINYLSWRASSNLRVYIREAGVNDEEVVNNDGPLLTFGHSGMTSDAQNAGRIEVRTNAYGQILARSAFDDTYLRIATLGWIDRRGRDD